MHRLIRLRRCIGQVLNRALCSQRFRQLSTAQVGVRTIKSRRLHICHNSCSDLDIGAAKAGIV
jgi:hypothetical protein